MESQKSNNFSGEVRKYSKSENILKNDLSVKNCSKVRLHRAGLAFDQHIKKSKVKIFDK